jgi:hypothetical protein
MLAGYDQRRTPVSASGPGQPVTPFGGAGAPFALAGVDLL